VAPRSPPCSACLRSERPAHDVLPFDAKTPKKVVLLGKAAQVYARQAVAGSPMTGQPMGGGVLGYWDSRARGRAIADGEYTVHVGRSSRNVLLRDTFTLHAGQSRQR
jgi:hypothetical protein